MTLWVLATLLTASAAMAELAPYRLRCEYLENPMGLDVASPRLSWALESRDHGAAQVAYRVFVATRPELLAEDKADLWDTGRIESNQTLNLPYGGKPLEAGQRAWWTVRVWDGRGGPSLTASPAWWEAGLLRPKNWKARWIQAPQTLPADEAGWYAERPAPLLRREFILDKHVARARAYVTGLGYYELRLNNRKVGDRCLDPAWTCTDKRVFYSTFDVTELLSKGPNVVGMLLGNGWYNPLPLRFWGHINLREHLPTGLPRGICELHIEYTDGTRETILSDESWTAADGPIRRDNIYLGEIYDARLERFGWDDIKHEPDGWVPVVPATQPVGRLQALPMPPIRQRKPVRTVRLSEPKPGVFIFDMGQNFGGTVTLHARGEPGRPITLRYGELLNKDGTLNPMTSVCGQIKGPKIGGPGAPDLADQRDVYIPRSRDLEFYRPRFTFHGFRYVEVTGWQGRPPPDAIEGHPLNSDVQTAGGFVCGDETLNKVQEAFRWTLLSNMFGVQSDCQHRERFGYGGDIIATAEAAMMNLDMAAFYAKAVQDLTDEARPDGGLTETAPFVGIADEGYAGSGPIAWGTAHPVLLRELYRYYGDRSLVERHYEASRRWVEFLGHHAEGGLFIERGISDHESLVPKPVALTGTAFYCYNLRLVSELAGILGNKDDERHYADAAARVAAAFNQRFLDPATGKYDTGTQACQAFALYFGLVPPEHREKVLDVLIADIAAHKGHLTTGIFGTKYMLEALSRAGRIDQAWQIASVRGFPGWAHMIDQGATTLWEHWDFSDNTFSHNHPMFGSVSEFFFQRLAGIRPSEDAVGFDKVIIAPQMPEGLNRASAKHETIRGLIGCAWNRQGAQTQLEITVPPNVQTMVILPAAAEQITEYGRGLDRAEGVRVLESSPAATRLAVECGEYRFLIRPPIEQ